MRPELRRFVDRVAAYTLAPPGAVLRMAMSVAEALLPPPPRRVCAISGRARGARRARPGKPLTPAAPAGARSAARRGRRGRSPRLARRAGCGAGVVRGLIAAGLVEEQLRPGRCRPMPPPPEWRAAGPPLSPDQARAASRLVDAGRDAAGSASRCSTASPARARPKPISPRSPRRSPPAGRCWCCCPRLRSARNGWSGSADRFGAAAGGMAFRNRRRRAARHLARGRRRPRAGRRRRALGAVPAVSRTRA